MQLLMEDGPDEERHQHFDFERIVEQQNLSKNKKKRLKKSGLQVQEDQFEVQALVLIHELQQITPTKQTFSNAEDISKV